MVVENLAITEVVRRFMEDKPLCFMTRCVLEYILSAEIDTVFEQCRSRQYESQLKFSALAVAIGDVALGHCGNFHRAYLQHREGLGVSAGSFYEKVNHVELATAEGIVDFGVRRSRELLHEIGAGQWDILPGYKCSVIDGNHLEKTERRIKELRGLQTAALPGTVVAKYNLQDELFDKAYLLCDAHAQESSVLDRVVADLVPEELILADRHFCIVKFFLDVAERNACFLIRHHARLKNGLQGERREVGRIEAGMVYEQAMRIQHGGRELTLRRVTLVLDKPTRDKETEIHLLCNVPLKAADARVLAELYHKRWLIENAFYVLTTTLNCELKSISQPPAALFLFCMALLAYNSRQVLYGALWTVHEQDDVEMLSDARVAEAVTKPMDGMLTAISEAEWQEIIPDTAAGCAALLCRVAAHVDMRKFRKSVRGPKKPRILNAQNTKVHVSTWKLMQASKKRP